MTHTAASLRKPGLFTPLTQYDSIPLHTAFYSASSDTFYLRDSFIAAMFIAATLLNSSEPITEITFPCNTILLSLH